jgi:hypothetical protein
MKAPKVLLVVVGLVAGAVAGNAFTTLAEPASPAVLDSQSTFVEMTPCRLVDTRPVSDDNTAKVKAEGVIGQETKRTYTAAGSCGVPSNATSLSVNLTSVGPTVESFMTLWDTGSPRPNASTLNPNPSLAVSANTTNVPLNDSGQFNIYNQNGEVHYVIDVLGYYVDGFGTSALPDLTDTGDGFSIVVEFSEEKRAVNPTYTEFVMWYYGAVINLENEARWVKVVSATGCPAFSHPTYGFGFRTEFPAIEPGRPSNVEEFVQAFRVEARSSTPVIFESCAGPEEGAIVVGGGTMVEAIKAQTFATEEFAGD